MGIPVGDVRENLSGAGAKREMVPVPVLFRFVISRGSLKSKCEMWEQRIKDGTTDQDDVHRFLESPGSNLDIGILHAFWKLRNTLDVAAEIEMVL